MRRPRLARDCIQGAWHRVKWSLKLCTPDSKPAEATQIAKPEASVPVPVPVPEEAQAKLVQNNELLESLPAEIRRHLLSTLEYDRLKALVQAFPVYHQQYLLGRQHLLCKCLEMTLGSNIIVDAWAVHQSSLDDFSEATHHRDSHSVSRILPEPPLFIVPDFILEYAYLG